MVTAALNDKLWVAYDATNCGLYKAWFGGVKFDGAVYTTSHGPQPTSQGAAYLTGEVDKPVWEYRQNAVAQRISPEFKGYEFKNGKVTLRYRFPLPGGRQAMVEETPEFVPAADGRTGFERVFVTRGLRPGEALAVDMNLTSLGSKNDFTTNGKFEAKGNPAVRQQTGLQSVEMSGVLVLNTDRPTRTLATFLPLPKAQRLVAPDEPEATHEDLYASTAAESVRAQEPGPREPGVAIRVYDIGVPLTKIPTLVAAQTPNKSFVVPVIDLESTEDFGGLQDRFLVHATGYLNIKRPGNYTFRLTSDDGSLFSIRDTDVIRHDGLHGAEPKEGQYEMAVGEHPFRIEMFDEGAEQRLKLEWKVPGSNEFVLVPAEAFTTFSGEVRVTSPGRKLVINAGGPTRPGDRQPLEGVHPSYNLVTIRPETFRPRVGGLDFLPDGRLVVCTWDADGAVYILSGVEGDSRNVRVKRIATGLAEPLGLKVVGKDIYVLQKQELTKLVDHNGDEVADEYFAVANGWGVTSNFHEFAFGLVHKNDHFYATLATAIDPGGASTRPQNPDRGKVIKINKNGRFEFIAQGLRTPNGIGLGYRGEIFVADNQGDWLPSSKILHIKPGKFYGSRSVDPVGTKDLVEEPPVVWLPQGEIGNSPSEPTTMKDGPYRGQMLHGDVTHGGVKRVFVEQVGGLLQGAVFRFTQGLEAGVNRITWGPDGALYIGGIGAAGNWGQEGKERYGLQKIKYNGKTTFEMLAVRAKTNGMEVELTEPLAEGQGLTPANYTVETWRYVPTANYGGPKIGEATMQIRSVTVSPDRRRVFLEVPGLKEGQVVYVRLDPTLASASGQDLWSTEAWYTLNKIPARQIVRPNPAKLPAPNTLTEAERAQGFRLLFDGQNLSSWQGWRRNDLPKGWSAQDGALVFTPGKGGGDIRTVEQFGDFELRMDWMVSPGGNSGVFYRATEEFSFPWATGPEMQVLDNERHPDGRIPANTAGSNYAMHAPTRNVTRPAGQWNQVRLIAKGNHVEHWMNGHKIVEYQFGSPEWTALYKKSKYADLPHHGKRAVGYLVLQDHGNVVSFRNIRIRKL
jgi:cytochrome c